ncbi:MAG: protein-disulfide reductase DsbD family protein [Phycisphaeraceae bacterium]
MDRFARLQPVFRLANLTRQAWLLLLLTAWLVPAVPAAAQTGPPEGAVEPRLAWSQQRAHGGDQRALGVVFELGEGFHVNPGPEDTPEPYIPTRIEVVESPDALTFGRPQYPEPERIDVGYAAEALPAWEGRPIVYLPVVVSGEAAPGDLPVTLRVTYQSCTDQVCYPPRTVELETSLEIVPGSVNLPPAGAEGLFAGFDSSVFADLQAGRVAAPNVAELDFFGWKLHLDASQPGPMAGLLALALVAGVLLNFTPCVLPVVPLKVMSLHQQVASGSRGRTLVLGLVFSAGIVACFLALGLLVAGLVAGLDRLEWGQVFSYWPVSVALAAVIAAMGLGMIGLYAFRLPGWLYMIDPSRETLTGNFGLGVLTAILSTPCTGPLLGGAITWAVKQPAWLGLSVFAVMGLGMALPYVVLTANPQWIDRLPRTGPGSELLKEVMGGLLLAVAAFFLGPIIPGQLEWWLVAGLVGLTMGWAAWRTWRVTARPWLRAAVLVPALLVVASSLTLASLLNREGPIAWRPFSQAAFAEARDEGRTVLMEFTADWCANCKTLELTTYRDAELAELMEREDYVAFRVDLTSDANEVGWAWQRKLGGGGGIPLAAVYHPGSDGPAAVFQGLFQASQLISVLEQREDSAPAVLAASARRGEVMPNAGEP